MTRRRSLAMAVTALVLCAAAPASAQAPPDQGGVEIGDPAVAAGTPIKKGSRRLGSLEVYREGDRIEVRARFNRRPPGRRARLCVTVGELERCDRARSRAGLKLSVDMTAPFVSELVARVRSGSARASVTL